MEVIIIDLPRNLFRIDLEISRICEVERITKFQLLDKDKIILHENNLIELCYTFSEDNQSTITDILNRVKPKIAILRH